MISSLKSRIVNAVGVASAFGAMLAAKVVGAVDPTLVDVTTTFTGHVSTILTFVVAVLGGFIAAMLIPMGLRAAYRLIRRLLAGGAKA